MWKFSLDPVLQSSSAGRVVTDRHQPPRLSLSPVNNLAVNRGEVMLRGILSRLRPQLDGCSASVLGVPVYQCICDISGVSGRVIISSCSSDGQLFPWQQAWRVQSGTLDAGPSPLLVRSGGLYGAAPADHPQPAISDARLCSIHLTQKDLQVAEHLWSALAGIRRLNHLDGHASSFHCRACGRHAPRTIGTSVLGRCSVRPVIHENWQ